MLTNCSIPQTNILHQLTKVWSRLGHSDGLNYSYSYSGTGLSSRSSQLTGLMLKCWCWCPPHTRIVWTKLGNICWALVRSERSAAAARPCGGVRGWDTTDELCSSQWEGGDCLPWPRCRGQLWSAPQSLLLSTSTIHQLPMVIPALGCCCSPQIRIYLDLIFHYRLTGNLIPG